MKRSILAALVGGSLGLSGGAQAQDAPSPVVGVGVGARVRIRLAAPEPAAAGSSVVSGTILEDDADRLVLRLKDDKRYVVERSSIRELKVSKGVDRTAGGLKGFGIGVGVGILALAPRASACRPNGFECLGPGVQAAIGIPALGVIGAVIGASRGSESWQTVETPRGPKVVLAPSFNGGPGLRLSLSF